MGLIDHIGKIFGITPPNRTKPSKPSQPFATYYPGSTFMSYSTTASAMTVDQTTNNVRYLSANGYFVDVRAFSTRSSVYNFTRADYSIYRFKPEAQNQSYFTHEILIEMRDTDNYRNGHFTCEIPPEGYLIMGEYNNSWEITTKIPDHYPA